MKHDFGGYATKNDIKCSDGRTIRQNAFKDNDGSIVPLVWMHQHDDPMNVLGHARLENRNDGVYAYCYLNDSEQAKHAKELVRHGDISAMSIFANRLQQQGGEVHHGVIREVSLVMAGANPGAYIEEDSFEHSDGTTQYLAEGEAVIYGDNPLNIVMHSEQEDVEDIEHADKDDEKKDDEDMAEENQNGSPETSDEGKSDETVADVFNTIPEDVQEIIYYVIGCVTEGEDIEDDRVDEVKEALDSLDDKQKQVVQYLVGQAAEDSDAGDTEEVDEEVDEEEEVIMKHNIFDAETEESTLIHAEDMKAAIEDGKKCGSMRQSFLEHGIEDIEYLFPDAKMATPTPDMLTRPMGWVPEVLNATKKSPFSRIKSIAANLTKDEARAKGYIKGKKKEEQQFGLLKRVTTPQTIYKKQALDRDDVIDITDFDVVAFVKSDLKMMIDEEIARAIFVGDGRGVGEEDKIDEEHIRPIYQDADTYTIHYEIDVDSISDVNEKSNALVDAAVRARKEYRGSGNPVFYASTDVINDMLLSRDKMGRRMYANEQDLAAAIRVSRIVEVPVFEGVERTDEETEKHELLGIIVNLADYTIGSDKGGELNFFDDFDIDFNKEKYLMETRISGCLTKPYSAIAIEKPEAQG